MVQVLSDPFFTTVFHAAQKEAALSGDTVTLAGPAAFDIQQQVADVNSLVTQGYSGIMLSAADPSALIPAVQQANSAHVKVTLFEATLTNPGLAVDVADTDTYGGGVTGGKYMCTLLGGKGQVAVIGNTAAAPTIHDRWLGFEAGLKANCPAVQVIATEITNNDQTVAEADVKSVIAAHPNLAGLFADTIVDAQGVVQGVAGMATRPKIVAFDAEPAEAVLLEQGKVDALVAQQPALVGKLTVQGMLAELEGKSFTPVKVPTILMTKANFAQTKQYIYGG
jgi:ribose transport system substrate-binding protein